MIKSNLNCQSLWTHCGSNDTDIPDKVTGSDNEDMNFRDNYPANYDEKQQNISVTLNTLQF